MNLETALSIIWNYLAIKETPCKADVIFVFGSSAVDFIPAKAAELFEAGFSQKILISGHYNGQSHLFAKPEAQIFAERLISLGVPARVISTEETATNTGENVIFGMKQLFKEDIDPKTLLLVGKPPHMRRCKATFIKHFPEIVTIACPAHGTLRDYAGMTSKDSSLRLAQEIERLEQYAEMGYLMKQSIPGDVKQAANYILKR
jgi:uncharacterized SAM-binding protein YcdF (DUF218 family)